VVAAVANNQTVQITADEMVFYVFEIFPKLFSVS
jgi:hypothetical protein